MGHYDEPPLDSPMRDIVSRGPTPSGARTIPVQPGAAHASRACIAMEATADEVRIRSAWYGRVKPRTPVPPLTPEMLGMGDALARAALQAEPGDLVRTRDGRSYVYRRGDVETDRVVI